MVGRYGPSARRTTLAVVIAATLATFALPRSSGADVSAVRGSAFGASASVSLFGGPPMTFGPRPTVTLPASGSPTPLTAIEPTILVRFGPATVFSSGPAAVRTQGTTGPGGSVTSAAQLENVNTSGSEVFTAKSIASTCTASEAATSGSTSVVNGTVILQDPNPDTTGEAGETIVNVPANPPVNTTYTGTVPNVGDNFRYVFNEQTVGADGSITVNAAHLYLLGPTAVGELIIGQSVCDVTAVAGTTSTSTGQTTSTTGVQNTTTTTTGQTTTTTTGQTTTTSTVLAATTTTILTAPVPSGLADLIRGFICSILRPLAASPFIGPFIQPFLATFGCTA